MTLARPDLLEAADAELLAQARGGDSEAFSVLYERHVVAARRLAYQVAATPRLADDVVSEAFGRMLDVVTRGGGPSTAFRPYVLTSVRKIAYERLRPARDQLPADPATLPDPDQLLVDPAFAGLETALIARAYQSLPERSRAVLWHTEIEHDAPANVAPLLGLTRNGVTALRRRAADDLRQAYLQMHVSLITQPGCRPVAERLSAFDRRTLSARDAALVSEHLARCEGCQVVHRELADIMASVRSVVAPLVLGPAAPAYLTEAGQLQPAVTAGSHGQPGPATNPGALSGAGIAGSGTGSSLSPARTRGMDTAPLMAPETALLARPDRPARSPRARRRSPRRSRRVAAALAAGAVLTATAAVALAMTLSGNDNPPASARQVPPAPSQQAAATQPSPPQSSPPSPSPQPSTAPASAPATSAPPPAAPVQLTASLSVDGSGSFGQVAFQVANTGSAASGPLTALIALPAGTSVSSGGSSGGHNNGSPEGTAIPLADGWSCQPTSGGATCTHSALAPGQRVQGMLNITVSSGACGQAVRLTVTGNGTTATASRAIDC